MAQDHTFRVTNERTGKVAYEGESYWDAAMAQTAANQTLRQEGSEPFWRMWLIDNDGVGCIVQTQQPTR